MGKGKEVDEGNAYGVGFKLGMLSQIFRQLAETEDGEWVIDKNAFFHGAAEIVKEAEETFYKLADGRAAR